MATKNTVTSIEQLKSACTPEIIELPGFDPDTAVYFKVRRANLRSMVKAGKVPNPLLAAAQRLYEGAESKAKTSFGEIVKVMNLVVGSAMLEPTMADLDDAGIELTEDQFGMLWAYSQRGASALIPFRGKPSRSPADPNGKGVEDEAE